MTTTVQPSTDAMEVAKSVLDDDCFSVEQVKSLRTRVALAIEGALITERAELVALLEGEKTMSEEDPKWAEAYNLGLLAAQYMVQSRQTCPIRQENKLVS